MLVGFIVVGNKFDESQRWKLWAWRICLLS